jgi:hypothetical protein
VINRKLLDIETFLEQFIRHLLLQNKHSEEKKAWKNANIHDGTQKSFSTDIAKF